MKSEIGSSIGLWTYAEAARYLGSTKDDPISIRSIMRLCEQRKILRVYPVPRKPRIDPMSVMQYVAELTTSEYDKNAQDKGSAGETSWQKSTKDPIPHIGGQSLGRHKANELENLLKSQIKAR